MGKRTKPEKSSTSSAASSEEVTPEKVPLPINTGNAPEVRRLLDEAVSSAVEKAGYVEDQRVANVKLVIMAVACAVACWAHFNPWTFPDNRLTLGVCCATYFILSGVLQAMYTFVDQNYIMFTYGKKDAGQPYNLGVTSELERFQDIYTLGFVAMKTPEGLKIEAKLEESIGNYFDAKGYFAEELFKRRVLELLEEYEQKLKSAKSKKLN